MPKFYKVNEFVRPELSAYLVDETNRNVQLSPGKQVIAELGDYVVRTDSLKDRVAVMKPKQFLKYYTLTEDVFGSLQPVQPNVPNEPVAPVQPNQPAEPNNGNTI